MLRFTLRRLLAPDGDPNGPASTEGSQPAPTPTPAAPVAPQPAPTRAAAPPAATIVVTGKKTESDVLPEVERKKYQTRISELEDENFRLKQTGLQPSPTPQPPTPAPLPEKEHWLKGWPFD